VRSDTQLLRDEEGTTKTALSTFTCKMNQAKATESGRDCLNCAGFSRQRPSRLGTPPRAKSRPAPARLTTSENETCEAHNLRKRNINEAHNLRERNIKRNRSSYDALTGFSCETSSERGGDNLKGIQYFHPKWLKPRP